MQFQLSSHLRNVNAHNVTGRHLKWCMTLKECGKLLYRGGIGVFGDANPVWENEVAACALELFGRAGVRRVSFEVWEWDDIQAAEEFITYFTLKHTQL